MGSKVPPRDPDDDDEEEEEDEEDEDVDQIRAARMLAGLTQADLARAAGCHPRSVRYWENKGSNPPTNVASTLAHIEQALNRHGVMAFSTPTPGVRLLSRDSPDE